MTVLKGSFHQGTASRPRICPSRSSSPALCPHPIEPFGEPALLPERFGLGRKLPVQEAAGHGYQDEGAVGGDFRVGGRPYGPGGRSGRHGRRRRSFGLNILSTLSMPSISSIPSLSCNDLAHPARQLVDVRTAALNQFAAPRVLVPPGGQPPLTQEILIVQAKLLQAGPGHVGQLQLGFPGGA
jgi:hypothetical protein